MPVRPGGNGKSGLYAMLFWYEYLVYEYLVPTYIIRNAMRELHAGAQPLRKVAVRDPLD